MRSNEDLADTLATLEVQIGWQYLTNYLNKIADISPHDIREAARKYIRETNQTTVYIIPGGDPDQPPENYTEVRSFSGAATLKAEVPQNFENNSRSQDLASSKFVISRSEKNIPSMDPT